MALIKDAEGRKDGGYTRLFGNEELGLLISKVQAAVITAGTELEAFKHVITEDMAMTGSEFCDLLGLDYGEILRRRASDQTANMDYFAESISKIRAILEQLRLFVF